MSFEQTIEVGQHATRLMGGITPTPVLVTMIDPFTGVIYCDGDLMFCPHTGMELNDEKEWGPAFEKTGSYLQEVLNQLDEERKEEKREEAAALALAEKEAAENGG